MSALPGLPPAANWFSRLAGTDFANGESTALFSFAVGANGHPLHRHAGQRMFAAITGSGGAQLRLCTASMQQIAQDPQHFLAALRHVELPADCLFAVRFGGTWHQFAPRRARTAAAGARLAAVARTAGARSPGQRAPAAAGEDGSVELRLDTRVACRNWFGRLYMALIARAHRHYIAPALLRAAAEALLVPVLDEAALDQAALGGAAPRSR